MAPVVARHYARMLAGETPHAFFESWRADRFSGRAPAGGGEREDLILG